MLGAVAQELRPPGRKWMPTGEGHGLQRAHRQPAEVFEELVLKRDDHLVGAGVALAATASDHLAIYPGRLVELGQYDMETALFGNAGCQFDVGAPAGHVRRDSDPPRRAGFGYDR